MQLDTLAPAASLTPVVVFGRDTKGKPHASRFAAADARLAERAAGLMGMQVLRLATDEQIKLATPLPWGRIFPSGLGFVPFVSAALFDKLDAVPGAFAPERPTDAAASESSMPGRARPVAAAGKAAEAPPPAGAGSGSPEGPDSPGGAPKAPSDWAGIGVGSTVLVCQGPLEGWWEAVVLYTKANDRFVLRWRDYPEEPEFARARGDLGLMPPGSREGLG